MTFAGKSEVAIPQQEDAQAERLAKYDQPASKPGSRNDEPQSDHGSRPHSRRSEGSPFFPRCNGDPQVTEGAPEQSAPSVAAAGPAAQQSKGPTMAKNWTTDGIPSQRTRTIVVTFGCGFGFQNALSLTRAGDGRPQERHVAAGLRSVFETLTGFGEPKALPAIIRLGAPAVTREV